jgi:hypothetical protein
MSEKIELKEKLAAIDVGYKGLWDEMDADQQKALKGEFFILNRFISNVKSQDRETQEHFVLTVNEYYNKHWNTLQKHPKLLWQLLCMCSHESKKIFFHEWIKLEKAKGGTKNTKFLMTVYPNKKLDEIEMMAKLMTGKELRELARQYGYDDSQIEKLFK